MSTLSIGMIVKNEERRLRQTLEALGPLRKAIDCQLIIADTGSIDGTLEIAREFADSLLQISWENDFAKARNATLAQADGEWFFYLDADEVLTDSQELIDFLRSREAKRYQCLSVNIRNRVSEKLDIWQDFSSERIFRRHKDEWFVGAIHETCPKHVPVFELRKTHIIHYGYNNDDTDFMRRKGDRNLEIMEGILANDQQTGIGGAKLWLDYADSLMLKAERVKEVDHAVYQAMALLEPLPQNNVVKIIMISRGYSQITRAATNLNRHQDCIDAAKEYFLKQPIRGVWDMDVYCFLGWAQMNLGHDQEASRSLEQYLKLEQQEKSREVTRLIIFATNDFRDQSLLYLCQIYQRLHQYDKMWQSVQKINKPVVNGADIKLYKWQMALDFDSDKHLPQLYHELDESDKDNILTSMVDAICKKDSRKQSQIAAGLRQLITEDEDLLPLLALATNDAAELSHCLYNMQQRTFTIGQGGVIRQCLRLMIPMNELLPHLQSGKLDDYLTTCEVYYSDWMQWACAYYDALSIRNMSTKELWLAQYLLCYGVILSDADPAIRLLAWPLMLNTANAFMQSIYQPELLYNDNLPMLSPLEQFIRQASQGEAHQQQGQYAQALVCLRQGLAVYPAAQAITQLKLAEIEQAVNPAAAELKRLAQAVKVQIDDLIQQGSYQEASLLIGELADILPDDPDIPKLLERSREEHSIWH